MNKGQVIIIFSIAILALIIGLSISKKNNQIGTIDNEKIAQVFRTDIIDKITFSGNLYPEKEIVINSVISGILDSYFVNIGDTVLDGDNIAKIKILPDPIQLESAKKELNSTRIDYFDCKNIYIRDSALLEKGVISKVEYEKSLRSFKLTKNSYQSAKNKLRLLEEGTIPNSEISNIVKSVTNGIITELPLSIGETVVERNNYREGSQIAIISNSDKHIFKAKVIEREVVLLEVGMNILIAPSYLKDYVSNGIITRISPRGQIVNGVMKYEIEASISIHDSIKIFSGFNAIAEVIIDSCHNAYAVQEKYLFQKGDSVFINIIDKNGMILPKQVELGVSDGITVELKNY